MRNAATTGLATPKRRPCRGWSASANGSRTSSNTSWRTAGFSTSAMRRFPAAGSSCPIRTSPSARLPNVTSHAKKRSSTSRSTTCRDVSPTPTRTSTSSSAITASPKCIRCRRSSSSRGGRIPISCVTLPRTATTATAIPRRWLPGASKACAIPSGYPLEDRTPDGRVYEVNRRRAASGGTVTVITDITRLKRAEEEVARKEAELHVALDNMPGALAYTDEELNIVVLQQPLRRHVSGASGVVRSRGGPIPSCCAIWPSTATTATAMSKRMVARRVESLRNPSGQAFEDRTPNGHVYRVSRRKIASGGTVTVITDITELKRIEAGSAGGQAAGRGSQQARHGEEPDARIAVVEAVEVSLAATVQIDFQRREERRGHFAAQEADDLLFRHRGLHRNHRPPGIRGADQPAQSVPAGNVVDRAGAWRDHRQVHRRRHHAVLRRPGDPRAEGGRHRLREDGDRHAAAHARPTGGVARTRPGARLPASDRHQHRLLHGRATSAATTASTTRSSATR